MELERKSIMQNTFYGIINNVDLALNCNSESVYDNNGRYVNELLVYDLCFDLKEHLRIDTDPVYEDNDGIMHYGEYGPFVRFGWEAKRDQDKPGHKGWWSSNNLAVFNVTGVWTIPCVYTYDGCRMACNIKVEDAPMYMPNDYSLVLDGEWNDGHWHIKQL
jgi:hypothetical protein